MLDILGRPPTVEEIQSLRDREETMRRELMQSVAEELLNQLQSQAPSDATDAQIDAWRRWMDMVGEPSSDPEAVDRLWRELIAEPAVDAPIQLEEQPGDDMSEYERQVREQLLSEYDGIIASERMALSEFDALARWIGGDPHYPRSSGLLPGSVEQPRGMWQIETVNPRGPIIGLELSSNGRFLAMANSGVVRIYDFDRLLSGYSSTSGMQQIFTGIPFYNTRAPLAWEPGADTADGGWLAAGTCEGTVRLLKFDGTLGPVLQTDDPIVVGVCWSPDGKFLAAAGYHGQVTIWDRSWQRVHEFRSEAWLSSIDWKPDGSEILVSNLSHGLEIWTPEGTQVRTIETPVERTDVAEWHRDGIRIALFAEDSQGIGGYTWLWGDENDQRSQGNSIDALIDQYNGRFGKWIGLPETDQFKTAFVSREDGAFAFGDEVGNLYFGRTGGPGGWQGIVNGKITGAVGELTSIAASPYGELTAISGESTDGTGIVTVINAAGEIETHLRLPARVNGVTWSPDGMWFVPIVDGEPTRIWKWDGTRLGDLGPGVYNYISWQPKSIDLMGRESNFIAAASENQRLVFTVTDRGEGIDPMTVDPAGVVTSLSWTPDGNLFFTGSADGNVVGCNATPIGEQPPHISEVKLMSWSPDGTRLATASGPNDEPQFILRGEIAEMHPNPEAAPEKTDNRVLLWTYQDDALTQSKTVIEGSAPVTALAWSPDGKTLLVTRGDNSLGLYSAEGQLISSQMLFGVMAHDAAWDPKNNRFAIGTSSGAVEIMRPDGTVEFTLWGHTGRVTDIEWSPGGDRLTAIAIDGTARCWNTANGEPLWVYVPAGPEEAITLRSDGVLLSRLDGTADSAFVFVGGTEEKRELHPAQFGPEEMIWDAIEVIQGEVE
jgi:WD40 repeat protein